MGSTPCSVLHTKCYSDDQIKKNETVGHVARIIGKKRCIQGLCMDTRGKWTVWKA